MKCVFCGKETSGKSRICSSIECAKKQQDIWNSESIAVPDGYITASEYAKLKNMTPQGVVKQCKSGKLVSYQEQKSGRWYVQIDPNVKLPKVENRVVRHRLKATQIEWNKIVEKAHAKNMSVNDYLLKLAKEDKE